MDDSKPRVPGWRHEITLRDRPLARKEHIRRHALSIVPRFNPTAHDTPISRAFRWVLPWERKDYPGQLRGWSELTGLGVACVRAYVKGQNRLPVQVALTLAAYIETRASAGLALAAELRTYAANFTGGRGKRPTGWQVVRERDGPGSVPRDGRPRRIPARAGNAEGQSGLGWQDGVGAGQEAATVASDAPGDAAGGNRGHGEGQASTSDHPAPAGGGSEEQRARLPHEITPGDLTRPW